MIVATAVAEDEAPIGFDLKGNRLELSSDPNEPPAVPTLVLVPAESFRSDGQPRLPFRKRLTVSSNTIDPVFDGGGGGGGDGDVDSSAWPTFPSDAVHQRDIGIRELVMYMRTSNDHEPWHKGAPEFYVMVAGTDDTDAVSELSKVLWIDEGIWDGSDDGNNAKWRKYDPVLKLVDWDVDYGTRVRIKCMESDAERNKTFNLSGSTTIFGVSVNFDEDFSISDNDDHCGKDYITPRLSSGEWTLIPDGPEHPGPEFDGTSELRWFGYGVDLTP